MIAVTGATGFIGRALCDCLAARRIAYRPIGRSLRPGFFAIGNIGPRTDWRAALAGVDVVVHLAARVHRLRETDSDPWAAYRLTNVDGTLNLARQAVSLGVKRLIFMSTVKVNGEMTHPGIPFTAEDLARPSDPYGITKLEAETGLRALADRTGLDVVIVRPPLVYGAGVGANFRALLSLVQRGVPVPLGAIHNKRSLVAVENLVDLLVRCIDHPAAPGEVVMAADGEDLSTPELFRALAASIKRPARLISMPVWSLRLAGATLGRGAIVRRLTESLQVDIGDTCRRLDWTPPFDVQTAFARAAAIGWFTSGRDSSQGASPRIE